MKKKLELHNMVIVVRSVFHEDNKYYPIDFLDECLYKLQMLEYKTIDVSKGIDYKKSDGLCECIMYDYWNFLGITFRFDPKPCNGCHGLM